MPETARVLQFPTQGARKALSPDEVQSTAHCYLKMARSDRSQRLVNESLAEPDVLLALCNILRDQVSSCPSTVAEEAKDLYNWLLQESSYEGLFDERDYFRGETALLAGGACRLLGQRDDADLWFDRAEAAFRHTVNPAPSLANVSYARLTLHYDMRRYQRVFELLPSLVTSFERAKMEREVVRCRFLEAMSLKECSRENEALAKLELLQGDETAKRDPALFALVLANLGELLLTNGRGSEAVSVCQEALQLSQAANQSVAFAHLKAVMGEALRSEGRLSDAVEAYRAAASDYMRLGMTTFVAYLRVVLAESLIALARHREAEWEILAALPTIEEQNMVPEGVAAIALLKESVGRRNTDPNALRELRQHLQPKK